MSISVPRTARDRARLEVTAEIKLTARRHLAAEGASGLSLRAVARDVGMVSSAVYRYFPSRDHLLTALIVDSYSAVGARAVSAEAPVRRADTLGRWLAVAKATRSWSVENPHEHGLIFGTPVPGYSAPEDTIDPAAVIPFLILGIVSDATATGAAVSWTERPIPKSVRGDLRTLRALTGVELSDAAINQAIVAWTLLVGTISFELFGHFTNVITDLATCFENQMRNIGIDLGLLRAG